MALTVAALYATRSRRRRRRVEPLRPPTVAGIRYAKAIRELMREWQAIVWAELEPELANVAVRRDAPLTLPDVRRKVLGLRSRIVDVFTSERVGRIVERAGAMVSKFAQRELSRVIGIPLSEVVPLGTLAAFRQTNIDKITRLATGELDRVETVLADAQTVGLRVEELAEQIRHQFDVSESYASMLARDQTLKLNAQVSEERQVQVGITRYTWITSRDERVRDEHRELDGTDQEWLVPPVVSADGRREHPGRDFGCRCTASPIVDDLF